MLFRLKECKLFLILYIFALLFAFISCENPFMVKLLEPLDPEHKGSQAAFTVSNEAEWIRAIDSINNSGSNRKYTITVTDDFSIDGSDHNTFGPWDITVSIYGNKTISLSSPGSLLYISYSQNIIMHDVNLKGLDNNNSPLVCVENANFTMESGSISGNMLSSSSRYEGRGGGVYVSGTFTMNGGEIKGNTSSNGGGGVFVHYNGTFIMNGGEIKNNTVSSSYDDGGGGVYVTYGTFTMNGGEIKNNTASNGGGVSLSNGTFTMSGGKITSNTSDHYGGGVYLYDGTFTMSGGEIKSNTASYNGGGVYAENNATLVKSIGGTIYGNDAGNLSNTAYSGNGHALCWEDFTTCDTTLGVNDNISIATFDTGWTDAVPLIYDTWANAEIDSSYGTHWYSFTANADLQIVHIDFNTLNYLYLQILDSSFNIVGSRRHLDRGNKHTSLEVISGQKYYIRVAPDSDRGTYRIAFNKKVITPGTVIKDTPLTAGSWVDGNILSSTDESWFSFTATANTQYIHIEFTTLSSYVNIEVFNSDFNKTVRQDWLGKNDRGYVSLYINTGSSYYIRVSTDYYDGGTYRIAFNTQVIAPGTNINPTTLSSNVWADGNITSSTGEQWFKFQATSSRQIIHIKFGTLTYLRIEAVNSSLDTVINWDWLGSNKRYVELWVTSGQYYNIRVQSGSSDGGTYQIAFSTQYKAPGTVIKDTPLTAGSWADGNITSSTGEEWFSFTATANTQYYIHVNFNTLYRLTIEVFNGSFNEPESRGWLGLGDYDDSYVSLRAIAGEKYYIRVWPGSGDGGTYKIAFNTSATAPP